MCYGALYLQDDSSIDSWDIRINSFGPMATWQDDILNICCNCAVVLFHLLECVRSKTACTFLHLLCTNIAVNITKVVIKILRGSGVTQTVQGGLTTHPLCCLFLVVYVCQKIRKLVDVSRGFYPPKSGYKIGHIPLPFRPSPPHPSLSSPDLSPSSPRLPLEVGPLESS